FSKSPFDLLLTAAAVLAIVVIWRRVGRASFRQHVIRAVIAIIAAVGFVALMRNLVDNARISPIPDHIVPVSIAQAVLLLALLLFGFAVAFIEPIAVGHRAIRMLIAALIVATLVYFPLQAFETSSSRKFIAETYAPLVI